MPSDYITTEMHETGSSVKQPRNMESEKGMVEAASQQEQREKKRLSFEEKKCMKILRKLAPKTSGKDYTLLSSAAKKKYFG